MPRKVDPKWGEEGVARLSDLFSPEEVDFPKMRQALDVEVLDEAWARMCSKIMRSLERFIVWNNSGPSVATRAEARRALELLLREEPISRRSLDSLNGRASDELLNDILVRADSENPEAIALARILTGSAGEPEQLRPAIMSCIDRIKSKKGPNPRGNLCWLVCSICETYEDETGEQITLYNKSEGRDRWGTPTGQGVTFVKEAVRAIRPDTSDSELTSGLRKFVQRRNRDRKETQDKKGTKDKQDGQEKLKVHTLRPRPK